MDRLYPLWTWQPFHTLSPFTPSARPPHHWSTHAPLMSASASSSPQRSPRSSGVQFRSPGTAAPARPRVTGRDGGRCGAAAVEAEAAGWCRARAYVRAVWHGARGGGQAAPPSPSLQPVSVSATTHTPQPSPTAIRGRKRKKERKKERKIYARCQACVTTRGRHGSAGLCACFCARRYGWIC